ncbi:hypothetical protein [Vibrio natriegens]|uniref:Uncharacterized protein n=1 Tax=Vibrio natriegens NBRC 15636 = ATCC 14048 = DSM 759 TaxID=1219067 RepID=A0AAN1CW68_VIBNA|nr:hypothetical protein [Vibrio natriegens]ALR15240.1 hypothetical protein PN96_04330 [Vibrio natriegens NBRC 15636 = ATCC 14048 = DSM 759]ANQ12893.1 hypothetical protein BA890_08960 [Vibrio natriegens NBRC 15636 = ATCC 14048 = DSM 759]EPM39327.1 hypothetical protein M272_17025 [Vibrio natriegens NBRC 15636 = ATCC 14048 = DSM 759]MDX6027306.1 hypothetical protein [Vibrio natriegens NBRC 15636 = ATCC 14048 = DSM 759]UUI10632.1 hypothetical protein NP431_09065 [Vibrio natriegens]
MSEPSNKSQSLPAISASILGCGLSILIANWQGSLWGIDFTELKVLILGSVPGITIAINKFFKHVYVRYSMGAEKREFEKQNQQKINKLRAALNDPLISPDDKEEFSRQYYEAIQADINIQDSNVSIVRD